MILLRVLVPYYVLPVKNKFGIISPANILYHAMHIQMLSYLLQVLIQQ